MEQIKKIQGEAKAALVKAQEDIRKYVDRHRSKVVEYKEEDLVLLSTKDLKWQMIGDNLEKLTECYVCKKTKLQAGIKPTALCSAIDKENLIEFLLDFLYYLYNYYIVCSLLSHAYHVTHHVTLCYVML